MLAGISRNGRFRELVRAAATQRLERASWPAMESRGEQAKSKAPAMGMNGIQSGSHKRRPLSSSCSQPRATRSRAAHSGLRVSLRPKCPKSRWRKGECIWRHGKKSRQRRPALSRRQKKKSGPIAASSSPPLLQVRVHFTHDKVRVQDAKLDGLDALDGRRGVREAVHRRHDGDTGRGGAAVGSPLVVSALLSLPRDRRSLACACAGPDGLQQRHAEKQSRRRDRERERCLFSFSFFSFVAFRSLPWRRWARKCIEGFFSAIAAATKKKTKKLKTQEKSRKAFIFQLAATQDIDSFCSALFVRPCLSTNSLHSPGKAVEARPVLSRNSKAKKREGESRFNSSSLRRQSPCFSSTSSSFSESPRRGETLTLTATPRHQQTPARLPPPHGRPGAHDPAPGGPLRARGAVLGGAGLEREGAGRRGGGGLALRARPARGSGPAGRGEGAAAAGDAGRGGTPGPGLRRVERRSGEEGKVFFSFPSLFRPPSVSPLSLTLFNSPNPTTTRKLFSSSTAPWAASGVAAGGPPSWDGPGSRDCGRRTRGGCLW